MINKEDLNELKGEKINKNINYEFNQENMKNKRKNISI